MKIYSIQLCGVCYRVTAVEMSEDSSLLGAGFADSYIRVWSTSPNKLRGIKKNSELQLIDKEAGMKLRIILVQMSKAPCLMEFYFSAVSRHSICVEHKIKYTRIDLCFV